MPGRTLNRLALWLVGFAVAVASPAAGAEETCTLRAGWEPYAPYTYAGLDGRATGADIDIVTLVGEAIGCRTEFRELPWARILLELRNGGLDLTTSASRTAERESWAWFSIPYRRAQTALFVRRGEAGRYPLSDLRDIVERKFRLGYNIDYHYHDEWQELMRDPAFVAWTDGAVDYQTNIHKLIQGRTDGFLVEDVAVMVAEMRALGVEDALERHPLPLPGEDLHVMLGRASVSEERVAAVDAALRRLEADGEIEAVISRYVSAGR